MKRYLQVLVVLLAFTAIPCQADAVGEDNAPRPSRGRFKYLISGDPKTQRFVGACVATVLLARLGYGLWKYVGETRALAATKPRKPWDM
jgi:hypothetical protein